MGCTKYGVVAMVVLFAMAASAEGVGSDAGTRQEYVDVVAASEAGLAQDEEMHCPPFFNEDGSIHEHCLCAAGQDPLEKCKDDEN